jgi:GrpB-like predicted nucleotidyltransferase (UPF0157 family)
VATTSDDEIAAATIDALRPYAVKVVIEDYNPDWPMWYSAERAAICAVLGPTVVRIEHTGSTAVPGLAAKPVIDMLLVVGDASDEATYVPALESVGYTLRSREPSWYEHRFLTRRVDEGAPTINLHVFPATSAAPEIERMLVFRDWLRTHDEDRAYYERTKRRLASNNWKYLHHYANAKKSDVIEEILTRAVRRRAARP